MRWLRTLALERKRLSWWHGVFVGACALLVPLGYVFSHPTSADELLLATLVLAGDAAILETMWKHREER